MICVDNDYLKARGKLEEDQAALKATCKVLKNNPHVPVFIGMPREVKDVNDLLKTQGEAAVRDLVEQARDVRKIFTAEQLATGMAVGSKSNSYTKESGAVKMNDESLVKSVVRQEHKQVTYESERAISDREIG